MIVYKNEYRYKPATPRKDTVPPKQASRNASNVGPAMVASVFLDRFTI